MDPDLVQADRLARALDMTLAGLFAELERGPDDGGGGLDRSRARGGRLPPVPGAGVDRAPPPARAAAGDVRAGEVRDLTRAGDPAHGAARSATALLEERSDLATNALAAQIRTTAVDPLRGTAT